MGAMRFFFQTLFCLACVLSCSPESAHEVAEESTPAADLQQVDESISSALLGHIVKARADHDLIGIGAIIASSAGIKDIAVDGFRNNKSLGQLSTDDHWHIGSNTKALTALLYARLVEQDLAKWGATLPDLFPELAQNMDPAWSAITIEDLFAHRSGLGQLGGFWFNARRNDSRPITEQRTEAVLNALKKPPPKDPSTYDYNNLNYIIAGAAIEGILSRHMKAEIAWEEAIQREVFDRLPTQTSRSGFGFGPPQTGAEGHRSLLGVMFNPAGRGKSADNPAVLGPAGTVHATLEAHAMLAIEFLRHDSALISREMRDKLFESYPDETSDYAMGWGIYDHPNYGRVYTHSGSNTMWFSQITIVPRFDLAVIVNINHFSDRAIQASRDVTRAVLEAEFAPQP